MSIAGEIIRLQNAKASLKTSINAKTDAQHQIDDETLDDYSNFVDSIQTGVDTGAYKVNSISEMNNLTGMQNGDYCVVDTTNILPADYTRVDYIKSTGTQYINTNYFSKPNTSLNLILKFDNEKIGTYWENSFQGFISSRDYENDNPYIQINFGGEQRQKQVVFVWTKTGQEVNLNDIGNRVLEKNMMSIKGTTFSYGNYSNTIKPIQDNPVSSTCPLIICAGRALATRNTPQVFTAYDMYVYGLQIYENDVLVRNYIPCYRKSDNVLGLYDIINDTFHTNAGTGTFVTYQKDKYYDVYYYDGTKWKYV